jgi:hypothetical protein
MTHPADDAPRGAGGDFEIVIAADGRVIFRTATAEMLELARALSPEDPELPRRGPRARRPQEGEASGSRAARGKRGA